MNELTNKIIEKIAELNNLLVAAETSPSTVADMVTLKIEKPFNSKGRKVSINGAIGSLKDHAKAITVAPRVEDVIEEPAIITEPVDDKLEPYENPDAISIPTWDGVMEQNRLWACGVIYSERTLGYRTKYNKRRYSPYLAKQINETDREYMTLKKKCSLCYIIKDLAAGDIIVAGLFDNDNNCNARIEYYVVLSNEQPRLIVADKSLTTYAKAVAYKAEIGL